MSSWLDSFGDTWENSWNRIPDRRASYRALSPYSPPAEVAGVVNNILAGKLNNTDRVTLLNSATNTLVTDHRVGPESVILFMPITSAGASELGAGGMYITARSKNGFTIAHTSAATTRSFDYVVIG